MDARQFLAEFGHIANASGGIGKLRELILELAIRGQLLTTPDSATDARNLLAEISRFRAELVHAGKLRRSAPQPDIGASELSFTLPKNWVFERLGNVCEIVRGITFPSSKKQTSRASGAVACLRTSNVQAEVDWNDLIFVDEEFVGREDQWIQKGDTMISMANSYELVGKVALVREVKERATFGGFIAAVRPHVLEPDYLYLVLRSPYMQARMRGTASQTTNIANISLRGMRPIPTPIPPKEEQSRIVAKVNELMALCDKLEAQQQARRKLQNALRQSTLQAVASSPCPHELQITWTRLADNFELLFHAPDDVADLRQLAMDLAVRGLLTEQRSDDEPASELLRRIAIEHKEMVLNGELKRQKPLPDIDLTDAPFELPRGWAWARFPEIGLFERGKSKHRPRNDPKLFTPGVYPFVQTGEVARANGVINEYHSKYSDIGLAQSKLWPKGTLCITIAANIADAAVLGFDACFPDSVVGFIPASEIRDEVEYFLLFMKTAREQLLAFAPSTAQKNINLEILQSVLIPIPPKNEIKRILSRVKDINVLCDDLVNRRRKAQDIGKLFAITSIASINGNAIEHEEELSKASNQIDRTAAAGH